MTTDSVPTPPAPRRMPRWLGPLLFFLVAGMVALVGLLAVSINERRWESLRPTMVLNPVDEWEPDSAAWGRNYPREYDTFKMTRIDTTRTKFGGGVPRDYLDESPGLVILFAGSGFAKDYRQARGHEHSIADVRGTKRVGPTTRATCWTCKSSQIPRLLATLTPQAFYARPFADFASEITHPIGCRDCHDPRTMNLVVTRPALREAFAAQGRDIDQATHQEMRSLVCAQCHVEYYFRDGSYLVFPWARGTTVENMIEYYDASDFADHTHPISGTRILKAQHPDYELYSTGVHAYRGVSCADCHMPYRTEGGVKFTNHHVQSPLLDIATSCAVCHRWSEEEIRTRVEGIQAKVQAARAATERALVRAHFDVAAAAQAGASDADLAPLRRLIRHAQFRWDYVAASNGMGFHSPQEAMRILGDAVDQAQEVRVQAARVLARRGVTAEPQYPDVSTREKAAAVLAAFAEGKPPRLVP
jgi:nitrite reductase (cytochrome c-552)